MRTISALTHVWLVPILNRFSLFRLKIECEKLASEKTEIQRHYFMVRHFSNFVFDVFSSPSSTVTRGN